MSQEVRLSHVRIQDKTLNVNIFCERLSKLCNVLASHLRVTTHEISVFMRHSYKNALSRQNRLASMSVSALGKEETFG
jgi:hypothetical protein